MLTEDILLMIEKIRRDKKVKQSELCRGICSEQQLSKLKSGEKAPDFFLVEILLQRLGKTPDKLEIMLSGEEFEEIRDRDDIIDDLRCGRLEEASRRLNDFADHMVSVTGEEESDAVRRMTLCRLQGIYDYESGNCEEAEKKLRLAVKISLGKSELTGIANCLLAQTELENLLLLAEVMRKLGRASEAGKLLAQLRRYMDTKISDEEQLAKFLPKLAVVSHDVNKAMGKRDEDIPFLERALELQRVHGMLQNLTPVLGYLAKACKREGREEKAKKYAMWKEAVEQLFEHFGVDVNSVNRLYFNCCVGQFYLIGEVLREERLAQGISQEQLIDGVYRNPESLSRVENGKKPDRKKLLLLMEKLGIHKRCYSGRVVTDDYALLELYSDIAISVNRKEYDSVIWGIKLLRKKLDMSIPENRQAVGCFEIAYRYRKKELEKEEAYRQLEELLRLTYHPNSRRVPFEGEALLLNQMAALHIHFRKIDETIAMHRRTIECYENSHISSKYHFRTAYLMMENMGRAMEYMGYVEDATYWTERVLKDSLLNGKGNNLHVMLSNLIGLKMDGGMERGLCHTYTRWAYYITDTFKQYYDQKFFDAYEKKHFDESVDWY